RWHARLGGQFGCQSGGRQWSVGLTALGRESHGKGNAIEFRVDWKRHGASRPVSTRLSVIPEGLRPAAWIEGWYRSPPPRPKSPLRTPMPVPGGAARACRHVVMPTGGSRHRQRCSALRAGKPTCYQRRSRLRTEQEWDGEQRGISTLASKFLSPPTSPRASSGRRGGAEQLFFWAPADDVRALLTILSHASATSERQPGASAQRLTEPAEDA